MKVVYVLDRYTSKYLRVNNITDDVFLKLKWGDKISYSIKNNNKTMFSVGIYLGYDMNSDRDVVFEKILSEEDKKYFDSQQNYAFSVFPLFKESFKKRFSSSKPITARYQIFSHQIYFYFYAEERYDFGDYVKNLREKIGKNIFLFQIGARDMIRLSPSSKNFLTLDGRPLDAIMSWELPSVPMENIMLQNLDGRDIERLKGPSGRLKESISYETDLYLEESKKYPVRGSKVESKSLNISGVCLSFNIMNGDVTVKTNNNEVYRIPVSDLQFKDKNSSVISLKSSN